MGAPREWYMSQQYERDELQPFFLYQENVEAFEIFNDLSTQRNYTFDGKGLKLIGLNYNGVLSYLKDFYPKKIRNRIFEELKLIEKGMVNKTYE